MNAVHKKFASCLENLIDSPDKLDGISTPQSALKADIDAELVARACAETLSIEFKKSLDAHAISHDFVTHIPIGFARRHCIIGLTGDKKIRCAIDDISKLAVLDNIAKLIGKKVEPILSRQAEIVRMINAAYQQQSGQAQQVIAELDKDQVLQEIQATSKLAEDLLDNSSRAPVIKLVNLMLFEAVKRRASDVHVQPYEERLVVRMRIDGVLHDIYQPPKALQQEILSRIKVMGKMNIAERRLPQDGRATVEVGDRQVDLRISTLPTSFGERAVIRLLDKSARLYELGEIGMNQNVLEKFRDLVHTDHGIILVTGPTGSGKSTTLYSALGEIDSQSHNILTLEDPIEYRLEGISQTQVNFKKGMTFASGLRTVLRQDPDIIMVGEIRDGETASMAIQSALTGHLVFSTLHTNDAAGAVARLLDLGVEPYLLASSLLGVLAQRLVRKICPKCKAKYTPTYAELQSWRATIGEIPETIYKGTGCDNCMNTGYRERVGIFELLEVTEPIRDEVLHRARASAIKSHAMNDAMITLRMDSLEKVRSGVTTIEEVIRVTSRDDCQV